MKPVSGKNSQVITIDVKDLPSRGLPYSVKFIELRCLTLGELKYISSENLSEESLVEVYRSAIYNIDVDELSWTDFIFIAAHISTFTIPQQSWIVTNVCKNCFKVFDSKVNTKTFFEFEDLNIPAYPIKATLKGKEMSFGVITVKAHLENNKNEENIEDHLKELYSFSGTVLNMPINEAFEHIKSITDPDEIEITEIIDRKLYHGVKPMNLTCPECKEENEYKVVLGVTTIKPFRENNRIIDQRITFG